MGSSRFTAATASRTSLSGISAYISAVTVRLSDSPVTTTSAIPGQERSLPSSSSGAIFFPDERTIVRFARPVIQTKPSASMRPISPVLNHPSGESTLAVSSGARW